MRAKEYLLQLKHLDNLINVKQGIICDLRDSLMSSQFSYEPKVEGTKNLDRTSSVVAKIVDFERDLYESIDSLVDLKRKIVSEIDSLENKEYRTLLLLRYVNFMTWEKIAISMNYSYRWVFVIHGRALSEFENCFLK